MSFQLFRNVEFPGCPPGYPLYELLVGVLAPLAAAVAGTMRLCQTRRLRRHIRPSGPRPRTARPCAGRAEPSAPFLVRKSHMTDISSRSPFDDLNRPVGYASGSPQAPAGDTGTTQDTGTQDTGTQGTGTAQKAADAGRDVVGS